MYRPQMDGGAGQAGADLPPGPIASDALPSGLEAIDQAAHDSFVMLLSPEPAACASGSRSGLSGTSSAGGAAALLLGEVTSSSQAPFHGGYTGAAAPYNHLRSSMQVRRLLVACAAKF